MKKNLLAAIEADLKVVEKNLRKKGDCTKIDVTSNFGLNSTPDLVFKIGVIGCDSAQADKKNIGIGVVYCGAAYTEIAKFIAQLDTDYSHEYHDSLRADFIKVSIEGQADSYAVSSLSYPTTCCSNTFIPAGTEYYYEKDDPYFAKKRRILSNNCSIMKSNEELALGRANAAKCVIQETVGSRIKYDDHLFAVWNESSADKAGTYRKVIITVEAKNLLSYYTEYNKRTFQKNNKPRNAAEKALAQFSYRPC